MLKKNGVYQLLISEQGKTGDGIAIMDDRRIYVPNCIPGDRVELKVLKLDKRRAYGKLLRVIDSSDDRVTPRCNVAEQCGGCQLQHQSQDAQIKFKQQLMLSRLGRFIELDDQVVFPMVAAKNQYEFRNKMQFAFDERDGQLQIGLYASRSHRVVDTDYCPIMTPEMNQLFTILRDWYQASPVPIFDEVNNVGILRYLTIRYAQNTNQLMVIITAAQSFDMESLIDSLSQCSELQVLYLAIQSNPNSDSVIGDSFDCIWQRNNTYDGQIMDTIFGFRCLVSPRTFLQGNATMVAPLYQTLLDHLDIQSGPVLDLYCGAGILTMALSKIAKTTLGVDDNSSAITDARKNASLNDCDIEFVCDKAEHFLANHDCSQATVIMDPPRQGCHPAVLSAIIAAKPATVGLISCHVDTLGRDLRILLAGGYQIQVLQAVEMFCHSAHLEMVVVLR